MSIQIYDIGNFALHNYILETERGLIAIDTGYAGHCKTFMKRFTKKWAITDLKYIFLTHYHDDHAGFLAELLIQSNATVVLNGKSIAPLAGGKNLRPEGSGYTSKFASLFEYINKNFSFPPVVISDERALIVHNETDQFFQNLGLPIHILLLEGHTADSMGLYLPNEQKIFCGDASMNAIINANYHTIWIDDAKAYQRSWDQLLSLSCDKIYPSHGAPFTPKKLIKHRHYLDDRVLIYFN